MFLIEKMELYPFSVTEKHVVSYILNKKQAIENMTTTQIAAETYVSKSALVRIAQKLDFKGWIDFKKAYLAELNYLDRQNTNIDANYPFGKNDDLMSIANKIALLKKEAIDDTLSLISVKTFKEASDILYQAETIHVFAVSNNLLNAQEFQHNMSRIQKDVRIHQLQSEILFDAYLAKKNSCAIIISYSGETEILNQASRFLRRKNIPVILMTSLGDNSATKLAPCVLRLATREKLYSKIGTFSTDTSINYLLDCLYSAIFARDFDKNAHLRKQASEVIELKRTSSSAILQEAGKC